MKKRCEVESCKKVLPLASSVLPCKCEKFYCSTHRSSYDHSCSYDYRNENKNNLLKTMSTSVVAEKVAKI